jgi:hypothetical protein
MGSVGVQVAASEVAPTTTSSYSTANAFMPVLSDWGPVGQPITITSLGNAASQLGTPSGTGNPAASRTATCAVAYDAINTLLQECGPASPVIYASRVVHGTPVSASLALGPSAALTLTAQYPGAGGNGIYAAVQNSTTTFTLTLYDAGGYVLAASPALGSLEAAVAWCQTTGYVTAVATGTTLPATLAATALTGGTDNRSSLGIADVTTALGYLPATLGPGQVLMPGFTNTTMPGVWSALGNHALENNRVAPLSLDDDISASTAASDIAGFSAAQIAGYCAFWAGNRNIPGVVAGTTRSVSPDAVIAGLCARVDYAGNQNQAAAGVNYPLQYATTPTSFVSGAPFDTYSPADLNTLNGAGINTFHVAANAPTNYGFVSPLLLAQDQIFWQWNHARLRMALVAQAQLVGQPFVFSQIDGRGSQQTAFKGALQNMLMPYATAGALWAPPGTPASSAFAVDTGSDINTPATEAAGELNATITVSFSYFAQSVPISINVAPITNTTV